MTVSRQRGPTTVTSRLTRVWVLLVLACAFCSSGLADELTIEIGGIKDPLLSNVRNRVGTLQVSGSVRLSKRRLERISEQAERDALLALRPYGYYRATVATTT
ncbi:MAG: hypothetical protein OQK01_01960, partial [Xanthomonadales bacterium]|nr:hypothetical protein [Xanthomonadales bacterium]